MSVENPWNEFAYKQCVCLLGVRILICCKHRECLDEINAYFSGVAQQDDVSADLVIYCEHERADRYLFRSRPPTDEGPLKGVYFQEPGTTIPQPWAVTRYPPLPPLALRAFQDRFVGIHAAAVLDSSHFVAMLVGERGAGKSSLSRLLVNQFEYSLLTDETAYIHRRSTVMEPLIVATGLCEVLEGKVIKTQHNARTVYRSLASTPGIIKKVLFLQRLPGGKPELKRISTSAAFKMLCAQTMDVGSTEEEGFCTIFPISCLESKQLVYSDYSQLAEMVHEVDAFFKEN